MAHTTALRAFIVVEFVSNLLAIYADLALESTFPESLQEFLLTREQGAISAGGEVALLVLGALIIALVVSWIALWLLKPWARVLYTAVVIISLVFTLFLGPVVTSSLGAVLYAISTLASGLILGLVWFSELRSRFERPQT
jgi:hypothetical protein